MRHKILLAHGRDQHPGGGDSSAISWQTGDRFLASSVWLPEIPSRHILFHPIISAASVYQMPRPPESSVFIISNSGQISAFRWQKIVCNPIFLPSSFSGFQMESFSARFIDVSFDRAFRSKAQGDGGKIPCN